MTANQAFSKHAKVGGNTRLYKNENEMLNDKISHETRVHNMVAAASCSRRNPIKFVGDDALYRKNKVRERLMKKLKQKKAKK